MTTVVSQSCHRHSDHDGNAEHVKKVYTCSMHPQIIRYEPGNCPICNMKLIEKTDNNSSQIEDSVLDLINPTDQKILASVKLIKPIIKEFTMTVKADGYITYDQRKFENISTRYSGRIDKLYIKYKFQKITKGQKLFDIYSPELLTEQQNLIFLLNNDNKNTVFIEASKQKLKLLSITDKQIKEIETSRKANGLISVYSNSNGYVVNAQDKSVDKNTTVSNGEMSSPSNDNPNENAIDIKEGMFVDQGKTLFRLVNTDQVWAMIKIYENDIPLIKKGQKVELFTDDSQTPVLTTAIDFIEPLNPANNKTLNVRIYINNEHQFKIGQLINAFISINPVNALWLPKNAIVSLGNGNVVFVKNNKLFETRKIEKGIVFQNLVEVKSGITVNDNIAENAQFLIDSENFIKLTSNESKK